MLLTALISLEVICRPQRTQIRYSVIVLDSLYHHNTLFNTFVKFEKLKTTHTMMV